MRSHNYTAVHTTTFGVCKLVLWSLIVGSCCFPLTTSQQVGSNNLETNPPPTNRGLGPQTPSAIKVSNWLPPGQQLVFSGGGGAVTAPPPVFVNNVLMSPTMAPFIPAPTTPSPQLLQCLQRCPTTSEYNPICASNRQLYGNEAKFNCARRCGADIQIVRRGSCEGLLSMLRG